ncbi:MAG TPA: SpoVG family protein [Halanaerobiales bacterium]|nr:SpoVG family protein [Halanaerobiales bacterium]
MQITDVRVYLSSRNGPTKAYVNLTLDEVFVIRGIKVVEGKNGTFVSMPSRRLRDGDFQDICFPITAELREEIKTEVIDCYEKEIA